MSGHHVTTACSWICRVSFASQDLFIEWLSCSSAGWDHGGGLGRMTDACLGIEERGSNATWPISAPRMGMPPQIWLSCGVSYFSHLTTFIPWRPAEGNRFFGWNGCSLLKRVGPFWFLSVSWPWSCTSWVPGTTPPCTCLVVYREAHWVQLQALPCKLVPQPSWFLHQGIQKRYASRGVQGLNLGISGSDP